MRKLRERPMQVYLRPDQDAALRAMALKQNVAIAELVRKGIDRVLAEVPVEEDPLLGIIGLGSSDVKDLAENHDYYIVQAITEESRPLRKGKTTYGKRDLGGHKWVARRRRQKR